MVRITLEIALLSCVRVIHLLEKAVFGVRTNDIKFAGRRDITPLNTKGFGRRTLYHPRVRQKPQSELPGHKIVQDYRDTGQ